MTVKKFRQPEVKKKEFDFAQAMDLFKDKRSWRVCESILSNMDRFQRAGVLIDLLLNSKYRGFNQAVSKFKILIEDSKVGLAEKNEVQHYLDHLQFETGERLLDKLASIREGIILDILNYNPPACITAFHRIIDTDELYYYGESADKELSHQMDKFYKATAVDLCQIMWPEQSKGLKVLFGDRE